MTRYTLLIILGICSVAQAADRPVVIVVTGAEGAPEYAAEFAKWADRWIAAAKTGGADVKVIGREGQSSDEHPNSPGPDRRSRRATGDAACDLADDIASNPPDHTTHLDRPALARLHRPRHVRRPRGQVQPARAGRLRSGTGRMASPLPPAGRTDRYDIRERAIPQPPLRAEPRRDRSHPHGQ